MSEILPQPQDGRINVATLNLLLDKTRTSEKLIEPQYKRIEPIAKALAELTMNPSLVAIQEAQKERGVQNGETLARALGFQASFWMEHNKLRRRDEHIGWLVDESVDDVDFFDVGHGKQAGIVTMGDLTFVNVHFSREWWGPKRADQSRAVIDRIHDSKRAVVMGDTNALWFEKARRIIHKDGFRCVFHEIGQRRPITYPTPQYRGVMLEPWQKHIPIEGVSLDDIYVKGVEVIDAGRFVTDSDHFGLWATLQR